MCVCVCETSSHVIGFHLVYTYLTPHCCTIYNEEFLRQKERDREKERENLCVFTRVSLSVHKYISKSKEPYLSACKEP